ncbi:MAG: TonB-dependent receptor [Bacteroidota bacterium]
MKRILLVLSMMLFVVGISWAQSRVSGTVTDQDGNTVEGVAVVVKGTTTGAFTNSKGVYSLDVSGDNPVLIYSFVGKLTTEEAVNGRSTINVTLKTDFLELDEVVVTGYGTQARRTLTSSIARVDADEIANVPVPNFEQAIQGRVAGVNINSNSGTLGSGINVRVRGISSINANNQPLYVIDGIPVEGQGGAALGGPGTNPLVNINPNDIASIEILKDAAATAVFGARATNGVVLITTKRGQQGRPRVQINYYAGVTDATKTWDLLSGNEYAQLWNQAGEGLFNQIGLTREDWYDPATNASVLGSNLALTEGSQPDARWQDLIIQTGTLQEVNASVSGSTGGTSFYLSGTYRDQDGFTATTNLKRYAFRANIDQRVNDWLKIGMNISPTRTVNFRQNEDNNVASPWTYAALAAPVVEAQDDDGNPIFDAGENNQYQAFNGTPYSNLVGQDQTLITDQTLTSVYGEFKPFDGFTFRTEFGVELAQTFETTKRSSITTDGFPIGTASAESELVLNYNWNNIFSYKQTFGLHGLDVTAGLQFQRYDFRESFVNGNTFADDRLLTLNSAAEITGGGGSGTIFAFQNNFLRVNYGYDNKYLLSLIGSYNGSSRFGSDTRYGFFPAVSAGWVVSNEDFLANSDIVNFLKLRASYGLTGNAEIGNFASRGLASFGRDYGLIPGYQISQLGNTQLTWERATQLDVALEFGLINNRVSGSLGYFNKVSTDLLFAVPLPWTSGFGSITSNIGSVGNSGIEFELEVDVIRTKDFKWSIGGNISTIRNEVLSMPDNDGDGEPDVIINGRQIIREGQPIGAFYMVSYAGVDPENGDALFFEIAEDPNGEEITPGDEVLTDSTTSGYSTANRSIVGSPFPDYFGGFFTDLSYKGFELSILFQYSVGNDLYRNEGRFVARNMTSIWNQTRDQLDAWTPDNTDTNVPEARLFQTNGNQHSSRYLEDASFLRLKNVRLAYTLPSKWLKGNSLTVFFQGQNLLTWTSYGGLDPEANGDAIGSAFSGDIFFSRPQARTITGGLTLGL